MDYELFKNSILEIASLITAFLIIYGFINPIIKLNLNLYKKIIELLRNCWFKFKKKIPFVWKKDYRSLENNILILQNELIKKDDFLVAKDDHIKSLGNLNCDLIKKLADYERIEWKDGIMYNNGLEICSRCYDTSPNSDRKTVRLLKSDHEIKGIFYCPECKTHPKTTEGAKPQMNKHREAVHQVYGRRY